VTWQIFLKNVLLRPGVTDIPESTAMNLRPTTFPRTSYRLQTAPKPRRITKHSNRNTSVAHAVLLKTRVLCDVTLVLVGERIPTTQRSRCIERQVSDSPWILISPKSMTLEREDLTILRKACTSPLTQRNGAMSHKTRKLRHLFHETQN